MGPRAAPKRPCADSMSASKSSRGPALESPCTRSLVAAATHLPTPRQALGLHRHQGKYRMSATASVQHDHHEGPIDWPPDPHTGKASLGKIGMWIFLLSDAFSFGGLLLAYGILRGGSKVWHDPALHEPRLGINSHRGPHVPPHLLQRNDGARPRCCGRRQAEGRGQVPPPDHPRRRALSSMDSTAKSTSGSGVKGLTQTKVWSSALARPTPPRST